MRPTKVTVRRDGASVVVELSDDRTRATIGTTAVDVKVVQDQGTKVELEIAGASIVVGGWPAECPTPPGAVTVNGEEWTVGLERSGLGTAGPPVPVGPTPSAPGATDRGSGSAGTTPVFPPMPGRVVEVRVHEGETVEKGAVLLVLEAMKMRNEVVAPVRGVVRELKVRDGTNVRAREAMLLLLAP